MILTIQKCGKRFRTLRGGIDALRDVSLEIESGEFFVLLGPSGCGKSTLLNLVAGLERPSSGEIRFGETVVAAPARRIFISPRQRNVAMVFQSYALYPHLDVFGNIAFPLKVAGEKGEAIKGAVAEAAGRLGLKQFLDRRPGELSGGQRQRVAIARALVRRPSVFLLDEPLSNLDAQLRAGTRTELKVLQQELGITTLYVTHDQTEAMTLGHRIALLRDGEVVQVGAPQELYDAPATPFAATFIGSPPMNLLPGALEGEGSGVLLFGRLRLKIPKERPKTLRSDEEVLVGIRPEHLALIPEAREGTVPGTIRMVEPLGREFLLQIATAGGALQALVEKKPPKRGENVNLYLDPDRLHFFEITSGQRRSLYALR